MSYAFKGVGKFGFRLQNNLTLERAVTNPKSNLARVIRYLMVNGQSTKLDICTNALNYKPTRSIRGWNCYLFRGMRKGGFIKGTRMGRHYVYVLGPNWNLVKLK
jgi:hypothetical protein